MNIQVPIFLFALFLCCSSCKIKESVVRNDDGKIQLAIVQMNDVYEIRGVDNGRTGGLSRVAHYYNQIKKQYPSSMLVLAGDFLSPSLIGTMRYNGERIKGRQMVEVLNAMDLDVVAFGNHEFDLNEEDLQERMNESNFDWIASNIYQICGEREYPFYKELDGRKQFIPESRIYNFRDSDGTKLDLGIFSATINSNPRDFVSYYNPDSCASIEIEKLSTSSDIIIGLTHLTMEEDLDLAMKHPRVSMIMGGHEHDHKYYKTNNSIVAKADANAKTVYLHVIEFDAITRETQIKSQLVEINEQMPKDPKVDVLIQKWSHILESNIKQVIPEPYEVIYKAVSPLDGREVTLRHQPTNMGVRFAEAMLSVSKNNAIAAVMNSGSIRIDDEIGGDITALDIFRALPYGGSILEITVTGNLLLEIMRYSENSKGLGAYLQYTGLEFKEDSWWIGKQPVDKQGIYTIAMNDFLLRGLDIPFLTEDNTGISNIFRPDKSDTLDLRSDVRKAIISYMKSL